MDSVKQHSHNLMKAMVLATTVFCSTTVFADDHGVAKYRQNCDMLPLVNTLIGAGPNTTVCVDAPVALEKAKVVFNLDVPVMSGGNPVGLRHMWMLGTALKARIKAGLADPKKVSIIGVLHGSSTPWALKDSPVAGWIEKLFSLNKDGVNISLEMCGVTMMGKGLTNSDLYKSENGMIHVNQGAIGRLIDLQQHKYAYIQED